MHSFTKSSFPTHLTHPGTGLLMMVFFVLFSALLILPHIFSWFPCCLPFLPLLILLLNLIQLLFVLGADVLSGAQMSHTERHQQTCHRIKLRTVYRPVNFKQLRAIKVANNKLSAAAKSQAKVGNQTNLELGSMQDHKATLLHWGQSFAPKASCNSSLCLKLWYRTQMVSKVNRLDRHITKSLKPLT